MLSDPIKHNNTYNSQFYRYWTQTPRGSSLDWSPTHTLRVNKLRNIFCLKPQHSKCRTTCISSRNANFKNCNKSLSVWMQMLPNQITSQPLPSSNLILFTNCSQQAKQQAKSFQYLYKWSWFVLVTFFFSFSSSTVIKMHTQVLCKSCITMCQQLKI